MKQLTYTQLAQHRENSTNPASIYQVNTGETAQCFLKLTNVSTDVIEVRVFHDQGGSTFDESTALAWDVYVCPGQFLEIDHIFMNDSNGELAYSSSVANAINATLYGVIR